MDRAIEISTGVIIAVIMIIKTLRDDIKKKSAAQSQRHILKKVFAEHTQDATPVAVEPKKTKRHLHEEGIKAISQEPVHTSRLSSPGRRRSPLRRAFIDAEIFNRKF